MLGYASLCFCLLEGLVSCFPVLASPVFGCRSPLACRSPRVLSAGRWWRSSSPRARL